MSKREEERKLFRERYYEHKRQIYMNTHYVRGEGEDLPDPKLTIIIGKDPEQNRAIAEQYLGDDYVTLTEAPKYFDGINGASTVFFPEMKLVRSRDYNILGSLFEPGCRNGPINIRYGSTNWLCTEAVITCKKLTDIVKRPYKYMKILKPCTTIIQCINSHETKDVTRELKELYKNK